MAFSSLRDAHIERGVDDKAQVHASELDQNAASTGIYDGHSDSKGSKEEGQRIGEGPLHSSVDVSREDTTVVATAEDLVTQVLKVKDDPSLCTLCQTSYQTLLIVSQESVDVSSFLLGYVLRGYPNIRC